MFFRLSAGATVVAAAVACAPVSKLPEIDEVAAKRERDIQQELAFRQFYNNSRRVHAITYPLLMAGADLCGEQTARGMGLFIANKHGFKKDYHAAAAKVGLGDRLAVAGVAPGSAGERAGAREGDVLLSINGWPVPEGKDAGDKLKEKLAEIGKAEADPVLTVRRGGKMVTLKLETDVVCGYGYTATENPIVNASADGKDLRIEAGMLRFLSDDDELAAIIGHEIAHNVMDHIPKSQANQAFGSVVDILFAGFGVNTQGAFGRLGGAAFSQEFEAEADYVGLYIVARASRKIDGAPYVWRRMALDNPADIKSNHAATHPATPHRFLALEKTVAEIKAKRAAGKSLVPEKQDPASSPAAPAPPPQ
ncbi:MAG: M48 family metalloprotease [Rhodospirillales bacterium]|nr:M48 family metalloprotease [Rhodospirillales bacterium]